MEHSIIDNLCRRLWVAVPHYISWGWGEKLVGFAHPLFNRRLLLRLTQLDPTYLIQLMVGDVELHFFKYNAMCMS